MYAIFIKAILWQHSERVCAGPRGDDLHAGIVDMHVCFLDIDHIFLLEQNSHDQGHLAHAVMNIDENLSVTENLFLPDSLEDWVHG